jgi:hypothetical protein
MKENIKQESEINIINEESAVQEANSWLDQKTFN